MKTFTESNNKAVRIGIVIVVAVIIIVSVIMLVYAENGTDMTVIGTVEGEPIYSGEFKLFLKMYKEKLQIDLAQKYSVDKNVDFWFKKLGQETALEILKNKALDAYVNIKVQQILMKKYHIIEDSSYIAFLNTLQVENNSRKEKNDQGIVVYGPVHFDEAKFYNYLQSNRALQLQEVFVKERISVSEDELISFYEENKNIKYTMGDQITVQLLVIKYKEVSNCNSIINKEEARNIINEYIEKIDDTKKIEEIKNKYKSIIKLEEKNYSIQNMSRASLLNLNSIENKILNLKIGEKSDIIDDGVSLVTARCTQRISTEPAKYIDIKSTIKSDYIELKYKKIIQSIVETANVQIDEKFFTDKYIYKLLQ